MRSSKKILWVVGSLLVAAGATYFVIKKTRETEQEIDEQEEKDQKDLEDLGVNTETLKNHGVSITENLVQGIHQTIRHSTDWDIDTIDPDLVLEDNSIVHVKESEFKGKTHLDFVFELPNYTEDSYKFPKIKDFKLAFDKLSDELWAHHVVKSPRPYRRIEAYVVISVENEETGTKKDYIKKVPQEWYKSYANEQNDGVARFYEDYNDPKKNEDLKNGLVNNFIKDFVTGDRDGFKFTVSDLFLAWRISFQVQNNNRGEGINLISATKSLKYITEEFKVQREGGKGEVKFEHILFHANDDTSDLSPTFYNLEGEEETMVY